MEITYRHLLLGATSTLLASTAFGSAAIAQEIPPTGPLFNCNGVTCEAVVCYPSADGTGDTCAVITLPDPGYQDPNGNIP